MGRTISRFLSAQVYRDPAILNSNIKKEEEGKKVEEDQVWVGRS